MGSAVITAISNQDPTKKDSITVTVTAPQIEESARVAYYSFDNNENSNFLIRKALNKDKYLLYDFVKENFNSIWADSLASIFPSNNIPIYLVIFNDHIIGFSAYDILGTSSFGPIGVLKEFRKNSIGKALLNKCLWDMKLRGDSIAIIKNAGPIEFYEKCCNAYII